MKLKNKKTIIILASVLAVVIATIVAIVLIIRSNDEKPEVATQTEIVTVTDDNGNTVTDEEGEAVTEVVTVTEADTDTTTSAGSTTAHGTTATTASGTTTAHSASSTTEHSTTQHPTTQTPSTQAPTTHTPTTQQPTTQTTTTQQPSTQTPQTTQAPTTQQPTTQAPTTQAPGPCNHTWVNDYVEHVVERAPDYTTEYHTVCNQCGQIIDGHATEHMNIDAGCVSYTNNAGFDVLVGYACSEYDWVKTQKCSKCGETKDVSSQYILLNLREWME